MNRTLIVPPVLAPAALGELKQWLAITTPGEDAALTALLHTALETCEAFTGLMPLAAECEEVLPVSRQWQALTTRPVQAVTGVGILLSEDYQIKLTADGGAMLRVVRPEVTGRIAVRFTAGLAEGWEDLPDGLKHGVLRLAAHHYRERESGAAAGFPPAAVAALWRPWRRMRVA